MAILILMRRSPGFTVVSPTSRSSNVLFDHVSPTCKVSSPTSLPQRTSYTYDLCRPFPHYALVSIHKKNEVEARVDNFI